MIIIVVVVLKIIKCVSIIWHIQIKNTRKQNSVKSKYEVKHVRAFNLHHIF